ncbi:MAG TPA: UPF0147 family protein [Thermoplasmata archaeon]|nr:UPF0147 family protein [Thermoplasmata archaeon]
MNASSPSNSTPGSAVLSPSPVGEAETPLQRLVDSLGELADDPSVPRNIRRGAQAAKGEILKPRVAQDVRIASAVAVLDELANDPNIPTHGRTAIWSIISGLESLQ